MLKLKQPLRVVPRKKCATNDDDRNFENLLRIRLLDFFTISHKRGWHESFAKSLRNTCERIDFNII